MTKPRVGVIGVGLMGHGIARNIVEKGWPMAFLDHPGNQPAEDLLAAGAEKFATAAEMARVVDVLVLCVTGTPQVEDVLTGSGAVLGAIRPGTIIVDCSTAIPASTERLAGLVAGAGGKFLDAAMTRTPKEAEEGRLNLLIGGERETYEALEPLLAAFSENRFYAGPAGSGHKLKLLHNFVSLGMTTLLGEAAACAATGGIPAEVFFDCLKRGGGYGAALDRMGPFILHEDVSAMKFSNANGRKDLTYYNQMASDLGAQKNVASGVLQALDWLNDKGFGDNYIPEQVKLFRA